MMMTTMMNHLRNLSLRPPRNLLVSPQAVLQWIVKRPHHWKCLRPLIPGAGNGAQLLATGEEHHPRVKIWSFSQRCHSVSNWSNMWRKCLFELVWNGVWHILKCWPGWFVGAYSNIWRNFCNCSSFTLVWCMKYFQSFKRSLGWFLLMKHVAIFLLQNLSGM